MRLDFLLKLYPRAWRRRYGDEYLALLEDLGASPGVVADSLLGAANAHIAAIAGEQPAAAPQPSPASPDATATPSAVPAPRPFRRAREFEGAIDQIIREAAERGAFDNLRGAGKPQAEERPNPFASEWEMAFRLVKQAGETLPWIALGREIEADQAKLDADLDQTAAWLAKLRATDPSAHAGERAHARRLYLESAARLDGKLREHGRLIPHPHFDRGRLTPPTAARRFDTRVEP